MEKQPWIFTMLLLGAALAVPATGAAEGGGENMASRIAALRIEVEELAAQVEAGKEDLRGQLRSFAGQKADLEMEIQRAELGLQQIREAKDRRVEEMSKGTQLEEKLGPAVMAAVGTVKKQVLAGLPFKRDERAAELDQLIRLLDEGMLRPIDALARLWDRVEDEYRLARENGLYRQVIGLGGEDLLVDVAKVGMVMMYFRARDGRLGSSVYRDGEWSFDLITTKEHKERVHLLFDSFKKQIRTGFFLLPDALPGGDA